MSPNHKITFSNRIDLNVEITSFIKVFLTHMVLNLCCYTQRQQEDTYFCGWEVCMCIKCVLNEHYCFQKFQFGTSIR